MTLNGRMREGGLRTAEAVTAVGPLVRGDRTRRIDGVIDYFGGPGSRPPRATFGVWRAITRSIAAAHLGGGAR